MPVVEDAAQAHGTLYENRPCGSYGTMGCFSFYPSKNLGACGDGGMVTTDDEALARQLHILRNYGQKEKGQHVAIGMNNRLDTLQAAILQIKLAHLPEWNAARCEHASLYKHLLKDIGDVTLPKQTTNSTHIYHLFIIETEHRDKLRAHLNQADIQTGVHYPTPIHLQPAYADLGYKKGDFPEAERLSRRILSLPMYPELTEQQIRRVAEEISLFFDAL